MENRTVSHGGKGKLLAGFWYLISKILMFILSMLVLSLIVFCAARLAPGDPLVSYYGERAERMTPEQRLRAEERLGLGESLPVQYIRWISNALQGDFGISYKYKKDVLEVIGGRMVNTLLLGGIGFLLIFFLALLLGICAAWFEERLIDRILCKAGTFISCIPEFWLALVLIFVFAVRLRILPSSGAYTAGGADRPGDRVLHLILPMTVVVAGHLWYYAYMIRNKLLEEFRAEYVLLAKIKGLGRGKILFRHCLRNVLPSYFSLMSISVSHILGGTYIVEMVFSYPGIGSLSYESARYQDYNLLMVLCILSGAIVIFCNAIAQAVNGRIDPRLRLDGNGVGKG